MGGYQQPRTRFRLIQKLNSRSLRYVHLGITCTTWGNAGRLNGGTRRKGHPYGDGSLTREAGANAELKMVTELCTIASKHGCHFSIENLANSYLFESDGIRELIYKARCISVQFDQCCYGLKFADGKLDELCEKPTCRVTNMSLLSNLAQSCSGVSPHHHHIHAWGPMAARDVPAGTPLRRAAAAGAYPPHLCSTWARLIEHQFVSGEKGVPAPRSGPLASAKT